MPPVPADPTPLATARAVAFVGVADLERARAFYEGVLGLRIVATTPYSLVAETAAGRLWVTKVPTVVLASYTVAGFEVEDITATAKRMAAAGVVFERYTYFEQDEDGIWTAPSGTSVAWFKDVDGNLLSISNAPAT